MRLQQRIDDHLQKIFTFKKVGEWYREGRCPQCNKKSCYTNATTPRVVKCNHQNNCGYEEHVKDICEELFKDWSKDFPKTQETPNASADAYLSHARGYDISKLRGRYTQELFQNIPKFGHITSATVRFKLNDQVSWERLIDRPERFGDQKANIIGKITGLYWSYHDIETLAKAEEIWLTEGIFDSIAFAFTGKISAATISSNNYPSLLLDQIKQHCTQVLKATNLPTLVWAFDNDNAGKNGITKFHARATEEGWTSTAALPVLAKESNLDWNDLFERDLLKADDLKKYRHFGQLHITEKPGEVAKLIYNYYSAKLNNFYFIHKFKTFWFSIDRKEFDQVFRNLQEGGSNEEEATNEAINRCSKVEQICNVQLKALYFHRDEMTDTSKYFFMILSEKGVVKETFTPEQITSKSNFANRLLGLSAGAWWTGSEKQLQTIAQRETEHLKEVKTIDYIGYSKEYQTYIFNKHAVHKGKIIPINSHDYYKAGKNEIKTLAKQPLITLNTETFKPTWWHDFYKINGEKGLIIMAWWVGSYFAEQIRAKHASYPFMEYVGQAGAGKSSYLNFLWKLSGRNDNKEGINPNSSTAAAIHRSMAQVSNLPVIFIEGDRKSQDKQQRQKFDWDELKDAYNGQNIRTRGLKTEGNETYEPPFRGAILISQNDPMNASEAILSRTLHIHVDIAGHTYEKAVIANRLYSIEPSEAAKFITHCLKNEEKILDTFFNKFNQIQKDYHTQGITHTRIAMCHAQIAAMLEALAKHILNDFIDLEELCNTHKMLETMAHKRTKDLQADHILVQQFWDAFEYINSINSNKFTLNHYRFDHQFIAINLNEVYKAAAKNYQALPDINDMRELLKTSRRYQYIEHNKQIRTSNFPTDEAKKIDPNVRSERNVKCWIFTNPLFTKAKP